MSSSATFPKIVAERNAGQGGDLVAMTAVIARTGRYRVPCRT
jgi:hypothetical protein